MYKTVKSIYCKTLCKTMKNWFEFLYTSTAYVAISICIVCLLTTGQRYKKSCWIVLNTFQVNVRQMERLFYAGRYIQIYRVQFKHVFSFFNHSACFNRFSNFVFFSVHTTAQKLVGACHQRLVGFLSPARVSVCTASWFLTAAFQSTFPSQLNLAVMSQIL